MVVRLTCYMLLTCSDAKCLHVTCYMWARGPGHLSSCWESRAKINKESKYTFQPLLVFGPRIRSRPAIPVRRGGSQLSACLSWARAHGSRSCTAGS